MHFATARQQLLRKPDSNNQAATAITGLARLDNRSRLGAALGLPKADLAACPDTELVMRAYAKWGHSCVDHLLGDFAFTILDLNAGEIFCARDHIGIAPFYYYLAEETFVFSDGIGELIERGLAPAFLDEDAVCCYLRDGELYHFEKTFYRDIKKLPPGHTMRIDALDQTICSYWSLEECPGKNFESQNDCTEQLKKLLNEAIATRLSDSTSFGLHLSGGLDSSGIAAIVRRGLGASCENLRGYTWNIEPDSRNEHTTVEATSVLSVAEHLGVSLRYSSVDVEGFYSLLCSRNIGLGDTTDCWSEARVREHAVDDGVQILVSGWGGDQFITHHGTQRYVELILAGKPFSALLEIWSAVKPSRRPIRRFCAVVWQLLVRPLANAGLSLAASQKNYLVAARPEVVARARELHSEVDEKTPLSIRGDQLHRGNNLHLVNRIESWSAACDGQNLGYAYPLLDKRIVEFAVGMDSYHYCHNGITRFTFRDVIKDLLPAATVYSSQKQEPQRARRDLSVCVAALKKWRECRVAVGVSNRFVDEEKLCALIDALSIPKQNFDSATVEQVGAIVRSIFVINLCELTPESRA